MRGPAGERCLWVALLLAAFFGGYYAVALHVDPARAHSLATPLDAAVPFVPASVYAYAWVYPAVLLPAVIVRSRPLFRRVALAYALAIGAGLACFAAFPVAADGLRPSLEGLDPRRFSTWGVRTVYALDPPVNLFPSLHLALALLAALCTREADRRLGNAALLALAPVAVSVVTVKQHFVVDAVAGVLLGAAAWAACVRGYRPAPGERLAAGWRGPAAYGLWVALVYSGLYLAFRAGVAPWEPGFALLRGPA